MKKVTNGIESIKSIEKREPREEKMKEMGGDWREENQTNWVN